MKENIQNQNLPTSILSKLQKFPSKPQFQLPPIQPAKTAPPLPSLQNKTARRDRGRHEVQHLLLEIPVAETVVRGHGYSVPDVRGRKWGRGGVQER